MHEFTTTSPPILAITILTALGTAAAVRILIGKNIIDAINHHGGHHEA